MQKYILSYASHGYYSTQKRFIKSIISSDFKVIKFTDKKLKKTDFYTENRFILDQKRGGGYWLWKPYILLKTLEKIKEGDFIIYCDSDAVLINSLDILFRLCENNKGIMIFDNSIHTNKTWTKRDCFILMDADTAEYHNAGQAMGGFLVFQKNDLSKSFIQDWLNYSCDYRILTDAENEMGKPNLPEFKEHRHDQSILSILSVKYGLTLFRDPSQFGNPYKIKEFRHPGDFLINGVYCDNEVKQNSPYDTLIDLRDVVIETKSIIKKIISRFIPLLK